MRSFLLMRLCDWVIVIISYFFLFMNADLMKKEIRERGWFDYVHSSYKKRKEKKLNMQGKGNMMLDCFIINIHMQLRRGRLGHNSSYFLKPRGEAGHNSSYFHSLESSRKRKERKRAAVLGITLAQWAKAFQIWYIHQQHKRRKGAGKVLESLRGDSYI